MLTDPVCIYIFYKGASLVAAAAHSNRTHAPLPITTTMTRPTTPSKTLRTHSRQVSSEAGTEFGTPESTFPTDTDSPTTAPQSTRPSMVGLGLSTSVTSSSGSGSGSESPARFNSQGDVFGSGQRLNLNGGNGNGNGNEDDRDAALDEVDQFLNEAARDSLSEGHDTDTRNSSIDYSKTRIELNMPGGQRRHDSSTSSFNLNQSPGSHTSDPLLQVLDNDDDEEDEDEEMVLFEDGDGDEEDFDTQEPLVRRRGRKRRRWVEGGERKKDSSLLEVSHRSRRISIMYTKQFRGGGCHMLISIANTTTRPRPPSRSLSAPGNPTIQLPTRRCHRFHPSPLGLGYTIRLCPDRHCLPLMVCTPPNSDPLCTG